MDVWEGIEERGLDGSRAENVKPTDPAWRHVTINRLTEPNGYQI